MHSPPPSRTTEAWRSFSPGESWAKFTECLRFFDRRCGELIHGGGESGIRTHGTVSRTHAFQACALSHSAISPERPSLEGARGFLQGTPAPNPGYFNNILKSLNNL